uniref:Reverse transcriptase domain-containing protein n=1 Tax=Heterorhabditis bacteriophora TaxID=37862 RepID=A0A1I7WVV8_HETBA
MFKSTIYTFHYFSRHRCFYISQPKHEIITLEIIIRLIRCIIGKLFLNKNVGGNTYNSSTELQSRNKIGLITLFQKQTTYTIQLLRSFLDSILFIYEHRIWISSINFTFYFLVVDDMCIFFILATNEKLFQVILLNIFLIFCLFFLLIYCFNFKFLLTFRRNVQTYLGSKDLYASASHDIHKSFHYGSEVIIRECNYQKDQLSLLEAICQTLNDFYLI